MATQAEYTAVANAILKQLNADIIADVPDWEQGAITPQLRSQLAGSLAKVSVDTLDTYREKGGAS